MATWADLDLDLEKIPDAATRAGVVRLLNLVEELAGTVQTAQTEIQRLRDEINRLKGEQGKPTIRPQAAPVASDHSSEAERRQPKPWTKSKKKDTLRIDRTEVVGVDPAILPPDAEFKGYDEVVVQDLILRPDTILFRKEIFYSPSEHKTYRAPLPAGYQGEFGPGVKTLVLTLTAAGQMSEGAVLTLLRSVGVSIAKGTLSNLLIKGQTLFHAEKAAVYRAGLASTPWQHDDDTLTRVNGQNAHCHVVCNPFYTAYATVFGKDRLAVLDVLRGQAPRVHRVNAEALSYLATLGVPAPVCRAVARWPHNHDLSAEQLQDRVTADLPRLGPRHRQWIAEATAVAAYQAQTDWPVVRALICDDAPQFKGLTEDRALCWVHEGRHYQKLVPCLARHEGLLQAFRGRFWDFYKELLAYQQQPSDADRDRLRRRFDHLFGTVTGYAALDDRIAKTRAKKRFLLTVLDHPEVSLHNNPAELGVRRRVRKRDVSFGPRTPDGTQAWDTFQTLVATTQKLGVSFFHYLQDRLHQAGQIPPLANLITERARALNLGASWPSWSPPSPAPELLG